MQPSDLGQANRYLYVGNNPVNETDPSGLLGTKCSNGEIYAYPPSWCVAENKRNYDNASNRSIGPAGLKGKAREACIVIAGGAGSRGGGPGVILGGLVGVAIC